MVCNCVLCSIIVVKMPYTLILISVRWCGSAYPKGNTPTWIMFLLPVHVTSQTDVYTSNPHV